jgi:hypothetical protein
MAVTETASAHAQLALITGAYMRVPGHPMRLSGERFILRFRLVQGERPVRFSRFGCESAVGHERKNSK